MSKITKLFRPEGQYINLISLDALDECFIPETMDIVLDAEREEPEFGLTNLWDAAKRILKAEEYRLLYMKFYLGLPERTIAKYYYGEFTQPGVRKKILRVINKLRSYFGNAKLEYLILESNRASEHRVHKQRITEEI